MPKTIIREFDESNAESSLTSEFAVAVPGYYGNINKTQEERAELVQEAIDLGIICDATVQDIYKFTSQTQFIKYIGPIITEKSNAAAPAMTTIPSWNGDTRAFAKVYNQLAFSDFIDNNGKFITNYNIYEATEIKKPIGETPRDYAANPAICKGDNRYLVKTFTTVDYPDLEADITLQFKQVDEMTLRKDIGTKARTDKKYALIAPGAEGAEQVDSPHLGNLIAYLLLGLGYTVYYKVMWDTADAPVNVLNSDDFWAPFKNKVIYPIRYITSGGCYNSEVNQKMEQLASLVGTSGKTESTLSVNEADTIDCGNGRGDCIALVDVNEEDSSHPIDASTQAKLIKSFGDCIKACGVSSKYSAIFAPRVCYNLSNRHYGDISKQLLPASFHYLACAANAQSRFAEWYAVAGYTRGVSTLPIKYVTYSFGEIAINTLAPRVNNDYTNVAANLILSEKGNYYIWGNRTAEELTPEGLVFSHFLNIRQLCCTIKKAIFQATRRITFSPNADAVWLRFVSTVSPILERMKNDNGINGYMITRVATKEKALLKAKIRIVPIEALEDFDISIYLRDSLDGVTLDTSEQVVA